MADVIVKCPKCPATANLGPTGEDISDTAYRTSCPEIIAHLINPGQTRTNIDCPYMGPTVRVAIRTTIRKRRESR